MRFEITCRCSAYKFPHRLSGGKCTGSEWAQSYYFDIKTECEFCNCNCDNHCDVATGQESINECEGAIHDGNDISLPFDYTSLY